jgi:SAM-dependent methyltransferase
MTVHKGPLNRAIDVVHGGFIFGRRVQSIATAIADQLPQNARVLDVGAGDGSMGTTICERRSDVTMRGIDVFVREKTAYQVDPFDGEKIPHKNNSFDAVIFVDVLHHTNDPLTLLMEAARVAPVVIVKDHLREGLLAEETLRAMDWVGNARHGVVLPYNYWNRLQWNAALERAKLKTTAWKEDLSMYLPPLSLVFGRSLHMVARFERV